MKTKMGLVFGVFFGLLILLVLAGFLFDILLGALQVRMALDPWQPANLPGGGRADRFLPSSDDYLYIADRNGRFYAAGLAPDLSKSWFGIDAVQVGELRSAGRSDCAWVEGPWTPAVRSRSPAVEGVECGYWTFGGKFYKSSFAILEDGSVWRWDMK